MTIPDDSEDFEATLQCPLTGESLRRATPNEIEIALARFDEPTVDAVLVTRSGRLAYALRAGIYCLLPSLAVPLTPDAPALLSAIDSTKDEVRRFYDELGWTRQGDAVFVDAAKYEDLRPVAAEYIRRCHQRVSRHLAPQGRWLLDVASGPVQYDDYLAYSAGYQARVCCDISFRALQEARRRLGGHGRYVLGDITGLPFRDGAFDGVVSLHTIYHVPTAEQANAFCEIFRVLAPGRTAAVVYSWGAHSPLMRVLNFPPRFCRRIANRLAGLARRISVHSTPATPAAAMAAPESLGLYSDQRPPSFLRDRSWPFSYRVFPWRSLGTDATKLYCHSWLGGRQLLRAVFALEERFPDLLGWAGQYPIVVISKTSQEVEA